MAFEASITSVKIRVYLLLIIATSQGVNIRIEVSTGTTELDAKHIQQNQRNIDHGYPLLRTAHE